MAKTYRFKRVARKQHMPVRFMVFMKRLLLNEPAPRRRVRHASKLVTRR
jgi:hypothetical protein